MADQAAGRWEKAFLRGGGQSGARLRGGNWQDHPLGTPCQWPASLQTALSLLLASDEPALVVWGAAGAWVFCNDAFCAVVAAAPSAPVESLDGAAGLLGAALRTRLAGLLAEAEPLPAHFELELPAHAASRASYRVSCAAIADGAAFGVFCTLKPAGAPRSPRVDTLAAALRTPLTMILGPVDDLLAQSPQRLGEDQRWLLQRVQQSARQLLESVEQGFAAGVPAHPVPPAPAGASRPAVQERRSRVLVAEDAPDLREYLRSLLAERYDVVVVENGEQALRAAQEEEPDLILTDVLMPQLDGFGLLRQLRADPRMATVPVIVFSALAGDEAPVEGLEAGADDYLTKPLSARELLPRVEAQLALARWRGHLLRREKTLRSEAETLNEVARGLIAELDLHPLVQRVLDAGRQLVGAHYGAFVYRVLDERGETQSLCQLSGVEGGQLVERALPQNLALLDDAFWAQKTWRIDDLQRLAPEQAALVRRLPLGKLPLASYLALPVSSRTGAVLGGMFFGHEQSAAFSERAQRLAEGLAAQAAVAIDNAQLYERAKQVIDKSIRAEAAWRESERRYRQLVDAMPVAVFTCDEQGRVTLYNDAARALWGREPDAQDRWGGARHLYDRAGQRLAAAEFPSAIAVHQGRSIHGAELALERADGMQLEVLVHSQPIRDIAGAPVGAVTVVVDITEQKQKEEALRNSERLYRAIGESIDYGVWISDAAGGVLYVSDSFLRLTGVAEERFSEVGWPALVVESERDDIRRAWRECVEQGQAWDRELRVLGADGAEHAVLARGVPVRNEQGQITGWAGIHLDIGRLKQAESDLREADQRKNEFLASLAHELRNPLAPIRTGLEVLRLGHTDAALVARTCEAMERQFRHTSRLVDDLLDVSRISRGKIELRRKLIPLQSVLRDAIETTRPMIAQFGHAFVADYPDEPIWLDGDETRLAQVITNLLNNAAKYTPAGGRIELRVEADERRVRIRIRDNGVGIAADMLAHVFEMFTQVQQKLGQAQGGLGIGLSISRQLIAMHGGHIEGHSDGIGRGSEFTVTLPRAAAGEIAEAEPAPEPGAQRSLRVLIADDHLDSAEVLSSMFEMLGHEVQTVHDGQAAVEAAATMQPQLIVLDIGMPRLDGYEACRRIRAAGGAVRPVIVALTGWGQQEDKRRSEEAGFDFHLVKPIAPEDLLRVIALAAAA